LIPETVTGRITDNSLVLGLVTNVTVGGTRYDLSRYVTAEPDLNLPDGVAVPTDGDSILTLNQYGQVVHIRGAAPARADVVYVIELYMGVVDGRQREMFRGVLVDGTEVNARVNTTASAAPFNASVTQQTLLTPAYFTVSAGVYTLTPTKGTHVGTATSLLPTETINAGQMRLDGVLFANNVRLFYIHGGTNDIRDISVRDGVQRVPSPGVGANSWYVTMVRGGVEQVVAVFIAAAPVGVMDPTQLLFVTAANQGWSNIDGTDRSRHNAWLNGVRVDGDNIPVYDLGTATGFYTFTIDEFGVYRLTAHEATRPANLSSTTRGGGLITSVTGNRAVTVDVASPSGLGFDDFAVTSATRIIDTRGAAAREAFPVTLSAAGLQVARYAGPGGKADWDIEIHYLFDARVEGGSGIASIVYITSVALQ